jgi:putative endonuclease
VSAGEIDLVVRDGDAVVAVEVKRARTLDAAAGRLSRRQMDRLCAALALFCEGQPADTPAGRRLDLALVDGMGRVAVRENAWGEDW